MRTLLVRLLVCVSCLGEGQGLLGAEGAATGLYYNRFRYYDPDSGQYVSQDPIRLESKTLNINSYVKDPNSFYDPYGLATVKIDGYTIQVHKNDVDPWPSTPHGHIYDKGWVVDSEGVIFKQGHGPKVGQLSKKGKKKWKEFLKGCG